jgi:diguanylate cyclase (GGDEF)-like protein
MTSTIGKCIVKEKKQLDLSSALRILHNSGCPDPRAGIEDPDEQIQSIIDALCHLSIHDGLTGLVNVTFFHAVLAREIERSLRTGRTCGLMVIDGDFFKQINDTYGHATGDRVLQSIAHQMQRSLRAMDTAARIGGEEFAIILPECEPSDAIHAAMRIHAGINPLSVPMDQNMIQVTTSAGLVWTNPNKPANSLDLLAEADQEMYRAKRAGRGRLCYKNLDPTLVSYQERSALMNYIEDGIHDH